VNRVLQSVLVFIVGGVMPMAAEGQRVQTLDAPVDEFVLPSPLPACGIRTAVAQLTRVGVRIGFESTFECWGQVVKFDRVKGQMLRGLTVRQILDRVVALTPTYRWSEMHGVAVVRPVAAWDDPLDVLSFASTPFTATDASPEVALRLALRTLQPELGRVEDAHPTAGTRPLERHFSITFPGGTLLDALNAVIGATRGLGWQVMYNGRSLKEHIPELTNDVGVGLTTFAAADVTTFDNGESTFYAQGLSFWIPRAVLKSGR
jgi:hypothetical protein